MTALAHTLDASPPHFRLVLRLRLHHIASRLPLKAPPVTLQIPTRTACPCWQRHTRALLRQPSSRRHARYARQLASRVPVCNHTLAEDALTVYRTIYDFSVRSFILLLSQNIASPLAYMYITHLAWLRPRTGRIEPTFVLFPVRVPAASSLTPGTNPSRAVGAKSAHRSLRLHVPPLAHTHTLSLSPLPHHVRLHAHWYVLVLTIDNAAMRLANEDAGIGVGGQCRRVVVVVVVLVMSVLWVLVSVVMDVVLVVAL